MKLSRILTVIALVLAAVAASAQSRVVLSYFEDKSGELRIAGPKGEQEKTAAQLSFGDEVPLGWTVVTGKGDAAELTMSPNGTIIKLAENTNFKVEGLQGVGGGASNDFALGFGKFRAVAARTVGKERYNVRGQTTVCGARGTDFGMTIEVGTEEAFVFGGSIDFKKIAGGASIVINAGEFANALAASFAAAKMTAAKLADLEGKLKFQKLDPASVPQAVAAAVAPIGGKVPGDAATKSGEGGLFDRLLGILGVEIGSVTIGDQTYAKAVIAPTISVNKLKTQLYLPIIYQNDIFNPNDWYKPAGNSEWSFGTDQGSDWIDIAMDFSSDLALKFKYLQYGDLRDPFFFKLGNLNTFTVGHGLIMRNYANDAEFPAIRRVGLNLGMDFRTIGFEAVVNDLADVQIVGGRLYLRPTPDTFPLAIGASGIVDLYPARQLGEESPGVQWKDVIGDPMLLNVGLDLDYGLIENDWLSVVLFADIAGMLPYYRKDGTGGYTAISEGLATDTLMVDGVGLRNYGWIAGVLGNVGPLDYRAEYRYYTGAFLPSIFDNIYDRQRGSYAIRTARYTTAPTADEFDVLTMGIYGEAGWTWEKVFSFSVGYLWPFTIDGGAWKPAEMDYLHAEAKLERGVVPFLNIAAAIAYDRYYFVPMLLGGKASNGNAYGLFDANTVVKSTLWYGVSKTVDIVFIATTTLARDPEGNVIYDGDMPELATAVSIETQIHF